MRTAIFTLCDFAQTTNGKTTIVGTFNQISSDDFPFIYNPTFYLAAKILVDADINSTVSIQFLGPDNNEFLPAFNNKFAATGLNGLNFYADIIINLGQVRFNTPGTYKVNIKIDSYEDSLEFYVTQTKK